jgi:hypothetical protein
MRGRITVAVVTLAASVSAADFSAFDGLIASPHADA